MGELSRHQERVIALQVLYALDIRNEPGPDGVLDEITKIKIRRGLKQDREYYFEGLVQGTVRSRDRLDEFIDNFAEDWTVERTACIDRNILRIALYEMEGEEVPPIVAVDEAVELAKEYGTEKSPSFINGLLSRHKKVRGKKG
ncbi:MAG: transcription antitermination factor NusB [Halanaerobiaceae bacterium]